MKLRECYSLWPVMEYTWNEVKIMIRRVRMNFIRRVVEDGEVGDS